MPRVTPLHWRVLARIYELAGCTLTRESGDHRMYRHPEASRPVVLPKDTEVPVFIILNNMRTLGMTRKEHFRLLRQVRH